MTRVSSSSSGCYYDDIVKWILDHNYQRIALQFPDTMLIRSPRICKELSSRLSPQEHEVFVIGDTKQGSCCVDEVNAEHYAAHCIIHFGHSCHTMPRRIPTYYVYDDECSIKEEYSNPKILYKELMHWLKSNGKDEEEILLIWETKDPKMEMEYAKILQHHFLATTSTNTSRVPIIRVCISCHEYIPQNNSNNVMMVRRFQPNIEVLKSSGPLARVFLNTQVMSTNRDNNNNNNNVTTLCGRKIVDIDDVDGDVVTSSSRSSNIPIVIFMDDHHHHNHQHEEEYGDKPIASSSSSSMWLRLQLDPAIKTLLRWDGQHLMASSSSKLEMRRYRLVEEVKKARKIGILFGSVDVPHEDTLLNRIKGELINAGREVYIFNVGQIEPAKLANFPEINCYVMLSCPESFPWCTDDFMVPIATPYEVEVALGVREWGTYSLQYSDMLKVDPMPIADDALYVQTLDGGRGELIDFEDIRDRSDEEWLQSLRPYNSRELPGSDIPTTTSAAAQPACIEIGRDGVAGEYDDELAIIGRW